MLQNPTFDVVATLAPVRRRLGMERLGLWTVRGAGAGAVAGVVIYILGRAWPIPNATQVSVLMLLAGTLVGAAVGASRWPGALEAARVADRHFDLHDRLTTALDYRSSEESFPALQRVEVARRLRGLALAESGRGEMRWSDSAVAGAAIVALAALLLFGLPQARRAVLAPVDGSESQRIHSVTSSQMPAVIHNLEQGLTPQERNDPTLRKVERTLTNLHRQLLRTSDRATALRRISVAQQNLHRLGASLHPLNSQAVAQINQALRQYAPAQRQTSPASSDRNALASALQTLSHLAQGLNHLSPSQRAQLAKALAQAANQSGDNHLRNALRQAASSLAKDNKQSAARSLQQASSSLAQSEGERTAQARLSTAGSDLDSLKNEMSGFQQDVASNDSNPKETGSQGQRGNGTQGQRGGGKGISGTRGARSHQLGKTEFSGNDANTPGGRNASGAQNQNAQTGATGNTNSSSTYVPGSGQSGTHRQGNARADGQGTGKGSSGGQGSHGLGGGHGSAASGNAAGYVTVYIPGKRGPGPETVQNGPKGRPTSNRHLVPYQLVIGQYGRTAHTALDRANLPPSLQWYVRDYFSTVSR